MPTFPSDSSPTLKAHIKKSEGLCLKAYLDAAGVPTIGYGHTAGVTKADVERGRTITEAQANAFFETDLDVAEQAVRKHVKVSLKQHQFDALVDFVFNLGEGNFAGSTLLKKLNAGDFAAVPAELRRWTKARDPKTGKLRELTGLVIRRDWEASMWAFGAANANYTVFDGPEATVTPAVTPSNSTVPGLIAVVLAAILGLILGGANA